MNLKNRLRNKATLVAIIFSLVGIFYQLCGILNIVPPISDEELVQTLGMIINLLVLLGVVVDPNTKGIKDGEEWD